MSVYLGSSNIAVSQHSLYRAQICTIHKQISGKRVPERMRTYVLGNASQQGITRNHTLNASGG